MSQITSCPFCTTRFRVVADQLRISDGWVRCGQCQEVFDAREHLVQLPTPASASPAPASTLVATPPSAAVQAPASQAPASLSVPASGPLNAQAAVPPLAPASAAQPAVQLGQPAPLQPAVQAAQAPATAMALHGYELPAPQVPEDAEVPAAGVWAQQRGDGPSASPAVPAGTNPLTQGAGSNTGANGAHSVASNIPESAGPSAPQEPTWGEPHWDAALQPAPTPTPTPTPDRGVPPAMPQADNSALPHAAAPTPDSPNGLDEALHESAAPLAADAIESIAQKLAHAESSRAAAGPVDFAVEDPEFAAMDSVLLPGFVRVARRKAWWQKPAVRVAMGAAVVVLPVALAVQVAVHERNALVAWQPVVRPVLDFMCTALQCQLGARQQIQSMVVSGSSFTEGQRPQQYLLGLSIQNRGRTSLGVPALELTLTDAQDQAIARKVVMPKELGAPVQLKAGAEWSGTVPVVTEGLQLQVSGYRVSLFYP